MKSSLRIRLRDMSLTPAICVTVALTYAQTSPTQSWPDCPRIVSVGDGPTSRSALAVLDNIAGLTRDTAKSNFQVRLSDGLNVAFLGMNGAIQSAYPLSVEGLTRTSKIRIAALTDQKIAVAVETSNGLLLATLNENGVVVASKRIMGSYDLRGLRRLNSNTMLLLVNRPDKAILIQASDALESVREVTLEKSKKFSELLRIEFDYERGTYLALLREFDKVTMEDSVIALARFDFNGKRLDAFEYAGNLGDFVVVDDAIVLGAVNLSVNPSVVDVIRLNKVLQVRSRRSFPSVAIQLASIQIAATLKTKTVQIVVGNEFQATVAHVSLGSTDLAIAVETLPKAQSSNLAASYWLIERPINSWVLAQKPLFLKAKDGRPVACYTLEIYPIGKEPK